MDTIGLAINPIRKAYHPNSRWAVNAVRIRCVGHMKFGSFPYGSDNQERMLSTRMGMMCGYVSS
jgi:hypothetical protein